MKTIKLTIELIYDPDIMHGDDHQSVEWFFADVLFRNGDLQLYSAEIGDMVGAVNVIEVMGSDFK